MSSLKDAESQKVNRALSCCCIAICSVSDNIGGKKLKGESAC